MRKSTISDRTQTIGQLARPTLNIRHGISRYLELIRRVEPPDVVCAIALMLSAVAFSVHRYASCRLREIRSRSVHCTASACRLLLALLCAMVSAHAQTWVTLPGDRFYQGDLEEGEPYGFGTMVYPNGTHYRGEFVNGYREGRGTAIFYDGTRYEGEWRNDIPNGRGVIEWSTGERYEGELVHNKRSGRGVMRFRDGTRYDGEWRDDDMNGHGVMTLPNGERQEGLFVNGEWRGPVKAQP